MNKITSFKFFLAMVALQRWSFH